MNIDLNKAIDGLVLRISLAYLPNQTKYVHEYGINCMGVKLEEWRSDSIKGSRRKVRPALYAFTLTKSSKDESIII